MDKKNLEKRLEMENTPLIKTGDEYHNMINEVIEHSVPNKLILSINLSNALYDKKIMKETDYVDLKKLEEGTFLNVRGGHPYAQYRMLILPEKKVSIWRNSNSEGLTLPIDYIFSEGDLEEDKHLLESMKKKEGDYGLIIRKGILKKGLFVTMPYFSYNSGGSMNFQYKEKYNWQKVIPPKELFRKDYTSCCTRILIPKSRIPFKKSVLEKSDKPTKIDLPNKLYWNLWKLSQKINH